MRKRTLILVFVSILLTVGFHQNSNAYDNEYTHRYINTIAAKGYSKIDRIMRESLCFENGIVEKIYGKEVWEWVSEGGKEEDELYNDRIHLTHRPYRVKFKLLPRFRFLWFLV